MLGGLWGSRWVLALALALPVASLECKGGGGAGGGAPETASPDTAAQTSGSARITITPTGNALDDAKTYLVKLCPKPIGGELNFMVWEGYTDASFAKPFEDQCGVKLNSTFMGSSDELVAKIRAGGAETIDLVSPSSDAITQIVDANLASPLDLSRLPSYGDLSETFRALSIAKKDGQVYGMPWAFGPNPMIYDTTAVQPAPDSWGVLWDPKFRKKLSLQDDIATLWMVAQYLGMDDPNDPSHLYNLSDDELARVKAKMLELRPNVRKYWSTAGDMTQLFASHEIVAGEGWPLMTQELRKQGFPVGEVIPKEGTTGWVDHWVMTTGAKNLDAAYAWLEYTAQPFTQKLMADVTNYTVSNPNSATYMTADQAAGLHMSDLGGYGHGVNYWKWSPRREKYQEVWNEIKAGK